MSGFFALRRADMPETHLLSPIGYKIGLELLVSGAPRASTPPLNLLLLARPVCYLPDAVYAACCDR